MNNRKEQLENLLVKVKAGGAMSIEDTAGSFDSARHVLMSLNAYNGSLDAAKELHEAVLPGWRWTRHHDEEIEVCNYGVVNSKFGRSDNNIPARAWLIAVLRALISEAGE